MSRSTAWRRHANRLAADRKRLYPGSVPMPDGVKRCPLHDGPLGSLSRMCVTCFGEAWEWTAEQLERRPSS